MKFTYSSGQRPLDGYTIKRGIGRGGFGEVLVEHFAHLRRRTLRNERDKVIIKIGSAD